MNAIFCLGVILAAFVGLNVAVTTKRPQMVRSRSHQKNSGERPHLSDQAKSKILANCRRKANQCRGQTPEYKQRRDQVKSVLLKQIRHRNRSLSSQDADAQIERRLARIHQLKRKLHAKNNLHQIEPADNGLWLGDTILSDKQIDQISQNLDRPRKFAKSPAEYQRRPRAAPIYFESRPDAKWTMPINYWISDDFTDAEKQTIDAGLQRISSATGCIQFARDYVQLSTGGQMQYFKPGDGCYGFAEVGYQGITSINVASCDDSNELRGTVMHETIHGLGAQHEMCRIDRDYYIEILYENIDPQQWYNFDIDNTTTTYGVPYDYQSIMHYKQGACQIAAGLDTMRPFVADATLSSNDLTASDILQLQRMYCSTCTDTYQECGTWQSVSGVCSDQGSWGPWMATNCPRSCGRC